MNRLPDLMTRADAAQVSPDSARISRVLGFLLVAWLVAAVVFVVAGGLRRVPPPVLVGTLTVATLLVVWFVRPLRAWASAVAFRRLVAIHLVRFVGLYFLWLSAQGRLPPTFAVPAGVGDMIAALGALVLLVWGDPQSRGWRRALLAWNVYGLIDMAMVVIGATRALLVDPAGMEPFRHLPLGVLPTFIVPLIIASHVVMLWRLLIHGPAAGSAQRAGS